jgi:uncharacterized protein
MTNACAPAALRVVLDTNAWLDLLLFEDPRCARLRASLADGSAVAIIDVACGEEWTRVLAYPALALLPARRSQLIERQRSLCATVAVDATGASWPLPRCRDPDDQKFLALARDGVAQFLLTRDLALLALAPRLRRAGRFTICTPEAFDALRNS